MPPLAIGSCTYSIFIDLHQAFMQWNVGPAPPRGTQHQCRTGGSHAELAMCYNFVPLAGAKMNVRALRPWFWPRRNAWTSWCTAAGHVSGATNHACLCTTPSLVAQKAKTRKRPVVWWRGH
eukprot:1157668-Pelagomonas_calceolata.AAC.2